MQAPGCAPLSLGSQALRESRYKEAAELLRAWCDAWRSTFGVAVLRGAWRLERAGDLLAACGAKAEAVEALLAARTDLARLSVPHGAQHSTEIEAKLRALLGGAS